MASPGEYPKAVATVLDDIDAAAAVAGFRRVVIKPNIVNGSPPPVTTDARCVAALADWLRPRTEAEILVAEGSGEGSTLEHMKRLGYGDLGLPLVDLDDGPFATLSSDRGEVFRKIRLPALLLEGTALISVPAAKEHTITGVTLGLKNLVGCLPAAFYGGYWHYKKSRIHQLGEDRAVAELVLYLDPVITLIDARIGLLEGHLRGRMPSPPLGRILAGRDVLETDRAGARLLGRDPSSIGHLRLASRLRRDLETRKIGL